jgi:glycosyltransferase involved in cell wall biosynthesis
MRKVRLFYASWCPLCPEVKSILGELLAREPEMQFSAHDIDKNKALAEKFGVVAVPTVVFESGGEVKTTIKGRASRVDYSRVIESLKGNYKPMEISLCLIVRNEENTLARCLESFKPLVDEIIVVDTGSTDKTIKIAKKFTDKVFEFSWVDDFSAARNFSFSKATKDWVMWVDADDIIREKDAEKFLELKREVEPEVNTVMMKYITALDDNGNEAFSFFRERIVRRSSGAVWKEPVHEYLAYLTPIKKVDIAILHKQEQKSERTDRNLRIYEAQKKLSTRGEYYYARELFYHGRFRESIKTFEKFLTRPDAWVEDKIGALLHIGKCYIALNLPVDAIGASLRSFSLAIPRAESVCQVAECFNKMGQIREAFFWYKLASSIEIPRDSNGFIQADYYNFIPLIECCVLADKLGLRAEAIEFNERAAKFKPNHPSVLYNREYFKKSSLQN